MSSRAIFAKSDGSGMFAPETIRGLIKQAEALEQQEAEMPSYPLARRSAPPQRPLSSKAQAVVKQIFEDVHTESAARQRAIQQAYDAGVASVTQPAGRVRKASKNDGEGQVAVYDENGNLVGVIDADAITPLASPKSPAADKPQPAAQEPQAGPAAAAAPMPTAATKAMSLGVRPGTHQMGGPNPRGGVPVIPAEDAEAQLTKALANVSAHGRELRKKIGPNSGTPAAEQAEIAGRMQDTALTLLAALQNRRR